ncbi:probable chitinase 10 [Haliotis asinina]|uniref:probable chitinase 10 n=1 Tax=Haliotis asinina TaxID=109174 RepID=UPI003531A2CE
MVGSRLFGLVVVFVACALAADYFADERTCLNIQPGLWVRDETDCMVAHQCGFDGEIVQSVRCNASQVWSKLASACVWEWDPDRDDCNGSPQVPIANDPRCKKQTGNNPDPEDCSKFVSCANGTLIAIQRCGDGTLYLPRNNTCEFAHNVVNECGPRKVPETIVIREEDPLCAHDGQVPDPESCKHFILCQHGRRTQRIQCPHGTSFSPTARKCEWHSAVDCDGKGPF